MAYRFRAACAARWNSHLLAAATTFALIVLVGCTGDSTPRETVNLPPTAEAEDTTSPAAPADTLLSEESLTADADPAATGTPAAAATPIATATPTPIPPGPAVQAAATDLGTRLAAYRAAARGRDVATALRAQRELLAAADAAEAAVREDRSRAADSIRLAAGDVRAGVAGDQNRLDAAERTLAQAPGGVVVAPSFGVTAGPSTAADSDRLLQSLGEDLRSYRQALRDRSVDGAVRAQGRLLIAIPLIEQAASRDQSGQGRILREAIADLRRGLEGDVERLDAAAAVLLPYGDSSTKGDADIPRTAASLAMKVDAFRSAVAAGSRADVLRIQSDILSEADRVAALVRTDGTPDGRALRDAIATTRAAVSGETHRLDEARAALGRIAGDQVPAGSEAIADLTRFAAELERRVIGFQEALQRNDTGAMLRLRRELAEQTDRGDVALREVRSRPAEHIRSAINAIRTAFAGDLGKLDDALVQLRGVTGNAGATSSAPVKTTDFQALAGELGNRLNGLRDAVRDRQPAEEIAKRRDALRAEVTRAEESLRGATGPRADRVRSALTAAGEAAAGDDAKIDAARRLLDEALQT